MKPLRVAALACAPLACAASLSLGGCVASYELVRYNTAPAAQVHLGCRDTYEVFDRTDAGAMLVGTNVLNEAVAGACGEGVSGLPLEVRMRQAARIFLEETTDRPQCRVTRETPLTPYQTEFNYYCPPPPAKRTAALPTKSRNRQPNQSR